MFYVAMTRAKSWLIVCGAGMAEKESAWHRIVAAGLPVVSTTCGGMQEVIDDGVDGYLVDIGDTAAMADRLTALGGDPDLRDRLGAAASLRAADHFDLSRQVDVFLRAYRSITRA